MAAIAILQMTPNIDTLGWLGQRFGRETPFVMWQATLALHRLARGAETSKNAEIRRTAIEALEKVRSVTDVEPDERVIWGLERIRHGANSQEWETA